MTLDSKTIQKVGAHIEALVAGCATLTDTLEREGQALGRMEIGRLDELAADREDALEGVIAADACLRKLLHEVGSNLNLQVDEILRKGPLAEAVGDKRRSLEAERDRLRKSAARVHLRAAHGLSFLRSTMGTVDGYGALGESRPMGSIPIKFYRVA